MNINNIMSELAKYKRIAEENNAIIKELENQCKAYLQENNITEYIGNEHKITMQEIHSHKLDTKALKVFMPDIYEQYSKESEYQRFIFK